MLFDCAEKGIVKHSCFTDGAVKSLRCIGSGTVKTGAYCMQHPNLGDAVATLSGHHGTASSPPNSLVPTNQDICVGTLSPFWRKTKPTPNLESNLTKQGGTQAQKPQRFYTSSSCSYSYDLVFRDEK